MGRAHALTDATVDDALTGIALIEGITGTVASLKAAAAYDTIAFYAVAASTTDVQSETVPRVATGQDGQRPSSCRVMKSSWAL